MLSAELNERLTRVGPGTPMGDLMRRYWHPVGGEVELVDRPTKRVTILGENLTLFKDKRGRYGLIAERCAHRRVNLATGYTDEEGLICIYHGWKYDATGQCIDQPAEPPDSTFKDRVKITSYPVEVLGGLVWAYLGPEPAPLLPRWDLFARDGVFRQIGATVLPTNWLQCQENSADSWHAMFTHGWYASYIIGRMEAEGKPVNEFMRRTAGNFVGNPDMKHTYERYEYGMLKRRLRVNDPLDAYGWTSGHPMIFPNYVRIGKKGWFAFQMRVPMDDTHTWHLHYELIDPGPDVEVPTQEVVPMFDVPIMDLPDFILGQDYVAWHEQGAITDRTLEMLGASDEGVILLRQMLLEQIKVVEDGGDPINTFRDPEKNQCIVLPTEDYGDFSTYQDGNFAYYDTGPYGKIEEVEALFQQAKEAALARGRSI
ncbi:MAG: Rieske 2Fe-2S domain-containing protein [Dehalococcoidia bacterium]